MALKFDIQLADAFEVPYSITNNPNEGFSQ